MSETLTITIDGKECVCEKGEFLYDVAKRNGIFIPVLCRSDAFDEHRACCRVCIVEMEDRGWRKVVTACVYPVEKECAFYTQSEKIKEERAVVMALLAHRAPGSERIAQMAKFFGGEQGFERLVSVDGEKCILCGLCVQACDSLGTGAISTVNRGTEKEVDTPYGKPSDFCVGCLSCANVCPTGAIEYQEDATVRTIWNRTFERAFCELCGKPMGTKESVAFAAKQAGVEEAHVCDECRKRAMADEMMKAYRYV